MKLRTVRFKDGRAPIHVIHNRVPAGSESMPGTLHNHARNIADMDEKGSPLDGFLVIGMFADGKTSIGYRMPERVPRCLLPGYISEIIRRDAITDHEAEQVFDSKFQWVE